MDDLSNSLGRKNSQFSVDRDATTGVNGGQSWIVRVILVHFLELGVCLFTVPAFRDFRLPLHGQQFKFVGRFLKSQGIRSTTVVPLPLAKRDKADTSTEFLRVVVNDVVSMRT